MAEGGEGGDTGEDQGGSNDQVYAAIADQAVEEAVGMARSMPVNAGQEALCDDMIPDIIESWDAIFDGKPPILIDTMHPEAVGIIAMEVSTVLTEAADQVKVLREIEDAIKKGLNRL